MARDKSQTGSPGAQTPPRASLPAWIWPALVALAGLLPFLPALSGGFFDLGDPQRLVENPAFKGLGLAQFKWIFLSFHPGGEYAPLTWLSHTLDYLLWGLKPAGCHALSLGLHALNGLLLYFLLFRLSSLALDPDDSATLGRARLAAAAGAVLFAAHPLRVEAVAWASMRGVPLSCAFALVCALAYLEAQAPHTDDSVGRTGWFAVSVSAYALSLLAGPAALGLPVILLLLDGWPLRRDKSEFREKLPFLLLALAYVVVSANARFVSGRVLPWTDYGFLARLGQTLAAPIFYLEKSLVPTGLSPVYEALDVSPSLFPRLHPFDLLCSVRSILFLAATGFALRRPRTLPAGLWFAYLALALPTAGLPRYELVQAIAGDRWSYVPGLCLAAAACFALLRAAASLARPWLLPGLAVLALAFGAASWVQSARWADPLRMWRHAADSAPVCRTCLVRCMSHLCDRGDYDEALGRGQAAHRLGAGVESYALLVRAAHGAGFPEWAARYGALARTSDPAGARSMAQTAFNSGFELSQGGRMDEALERTRLAIALDPRHPGAQYNMGFFLQTKGLLPQAETHYREAVRLNPGAWNARLNLGVVLAAQGKKAEAVAECQEAFRMNPAFDSPQCPRR